DTLERLAAPAGARQECDHRQVEGFGDRLQPDHRRIALPALDLRQVTLRRPRLLGKLPARYAALGARRAYQRADDGRERVRPLVRRRTSCWRPGLFLADGHKGPP